MLLPHERYVRYLITCGRSLQQINDELGDLALAAVDSAEWERVYRDVFESNVPAEIKEWWRTPEDARKTPPNDYARLMRDMDLHEAHAHTPEFRTAYRAAENEPCSQTLQAMLLRGVNKVEIAAQATARYGLDLSPECLETFEAYFFNIPRMSKRDLRAYYNAANDHIKAFLIECFTLDVESLKLKHGLPAKVSYTTALQEIHVSAMTKFREALRDRNPDSDKSARAWAAMAMSSGDRYEKYRSKDLTDFSKEVQMEFEFVEQKIPSISELGAQIPEHKPVPEPGKGEDA